MPTYGLVLGHPVGEFQARVAQRAGQRVAQGARLGGLLEVDQQVADRGAGEPRAQDPDEEDDRDRGQDHEADVEHELGADLELVQQVDERQHRQAGRAGEHRGEHAPQRRAGVEPAAHEDDRQRGQRDDQDHALDGVDALRDRRAGRRSSARCRPARRRRTRSSGTAARANSSGIITNASAPIRTRSSVPCKPRQREAGQQEGERQQPQVAEPDAGGQRQRLRPPAQQLRDEPDQPDHEHQRADVVLRPARPGHAAAGHERPPDEQEQRACSGSPSSIASHDRDHAEADAEHDQRSPRERQARGRGLQRGRGVQRGRGATLLACRAPR